MKNRQAIINLITQGVKQSLKSEIDYNMDVGYEQPYDLADAFYDAWTFAEENNLRGVLQQCNGIAIEVGYLIEAPENTEALGIDTRIQHNKIKYDVVTAWVLWIDEEKS